MKKFIFLLLLILQFNTLAMTKFKIPKDIKKIIDKGELIVGLCSINTPPFFYEDKNKNLHGIDIDIAKGIAKKLGVKCIFKRIPTFDEVINCTSTEKVDIAISELSITFNRAKKVYYTPPYFLLKMGLLINHLQVSRLKPKGSKKYLLNNKNVKIGVLADSSYETFAKDKFPNANIIKCKNWKEMLEKTSSSEVDAVFYDEVAIERTLREDPSHTLKFKYVKLEDHIDPIAVAVSFNKPYFFEWVKHYLSLNKVDQNLNHHLDKYFKIIKKENIISKKKNTIEYRKTIYSYILAIIIIMFALNIYWKKKGITGKGSFKFLLSPWAILVGMIIGVLIGIYLVDIVSKIKFFGQLYLTLLKMCSLPIMITAIISSLGKLFQSQEAGKYIKKLLICIISFLFISSIIGIGSGIILKPGSNLSEKSKSVLGKTLHKTNNTENNTRNNFLNRLIPSNIFTALTNNDVLSILIFSLLLGISLGFVEKNLSENIFNALDGLFKAFLQIINWSMYVLPFALISLMAKQISEVGINIMLAMGKFVIVYYITSIIFIIIMIIIMIKTLKNSFKKIFYSLKNPSIIAFGTSNSYAAMPLAINSLEDDLNLEKETTNLVMPLSVTLCRPGTILNLALGTVFIAQLFDISLLENYKWIIAIFGVILSGIAAAGAPSAIEISMLCIVFSFLKLPIEVAMILLMAVDPITDPIRTLFNIISSCTITSFISTKKKL